MKKIIGLFPEQEENWGEWRLMEKGTKVCENSITDIQSVEVFGKRWFEVSFGDGRTFLVNPDKIMTVEIVDVEL